MPNDSGVNCCAALCARFWGERNPQNSLGAQVCAVNALPVQYGTRGWRAADPGMRVAPLRVYIKFLAVVL